MKLKLEFPKKESLVKKLQLLALLLSTSLAVPGILAGCLGSGSLREASYVPGSYEGTGRGYRGPVVVRVQISPAGIEDIAIISHKEAPYPGAAAMEELLDLVLETGSTDLDAVSGASFSSRGFLEAVENALGQAHEKAAGRQ